MRVTQVLRPREWRNREADMAAWPCGQGQWPGARVDGCGPPIGRRLSPADLGAGQTGWWLGDGRRAHNANKIGLRMPRSAPPCPERSDAAFVLVYRSYLVPHRRNMTLPPLLPEGPSRTAAQPRRPGPAIASFPERGRACAQGRKPGPLPDATFAMGVLVWAFGGRLGEYR